MTTTIADLSTDPKYTIKTVCTQTGIRAVTLRAWERRYELLSPERSESRYRLYSDQDVALLRWVKSRVDSGISISSVASELKKLQQADQWPEPLPTVQQQPSRLKAVPPEHLAADLYQALRRHDEEAANEVLATAHAAYDLLTIFTQIISPCLVEIGDAWYRGDIRITTEHFASNYLRGKLLALLQAFPTRRGMSYLLVGCAPNEQHELGALMLAVLLRREGYRLEYLGVDIPLEDLADYARYERPAMIILSATSDASGAELRSFQALLGKIRPTPLFAFGGPVFARDAALRASVSGIYLGNSYEEALNTVHKYLS